jgi:hypothetical protein
MMAGAPMNPSLHRRAQHSTRTWTDARIPLAIGDPGEGMEHLWSPAGATGGNRWQMGHPRKPLKQADPQPSATHGNGSGDGKEGVNGSSPLEGFREAPAQQLLSLSAKKAFRSGGVHETSTAPNVSELPVLQPLSPSGFAGSAAAST